MNHITKIIRVQIRICLVFRTLLCLAIRSQYIFLICLDRDFVSSSLHTLVDYIAALCPARSVREFKKKFCMLQNEITCVFFQRLSFLEILFYLQNKLGVPEQTRHK